MNYESYGFRLCSTRLTLPFLFHGKTPRNNVPLYFPEMNFDDISAKRENNI